jgi:iron complex outermembrane receptor protein
MRQFESGSLGARLRGSVGAVALLAGIAWPTSHGLAQQTAATGSDQLQEVVVTAEKRSENIQDVPIAVTAFTAEALHDRAITDITGLGGLTPNTNLDTASPFGGSHQILSASIRGIGQDDFAINLDPGVGVYVDGIYYARTVGANADLLDVDRVEILKGPQGTLFGRNTIGGAISVVTREPGTDYTATAEVTTGSFNRLDFSGTADIPISDTLLSSITFSSVNRDGYQQRIPYQSPVPYVTDPPGTFHNNGTEAASTQGGQGEDILRIKLLWKARDDLKITATADWTHVDESASAESLLATATSPAIPGSAFGFFYNACITAHFFPTVCGPRGPGLSQTVGTPVGLFAPGNAGVSLGTGLFAADLKPSTYRLPFGNQFITSNIDTTYATGPNFDKMDNFGGAVTADWSLADNLDLKAITGYRRLNWSVGLDPDASPVDMNIGGFTEGQHQFSEELQLTGSALDDRLKFVTGLYYFNEGGFEHDYVVLGAGLLQIEGLAKIDTSSYAGYSHVDYTVFDKLTLVLGARYSYDHKTVQEYQDDLNAFDYKIVTATTPLPCYPVNAACAPIIGFPSSNNPLQYLPGNQVAQDFYVFTPTAGLQYQFDPDLMSYFTYSKGFKSGGWTVRVTQPVPDQPSFGPEKAQTFEIGTKSKWLDNHLLVDVAGFYTEYDSIQLNFQQGTTPTIENAGNAEILGTELEGRWLFGQGLSLGGTAGYMDAYYTSLKNGINAGQACVQPYEPCITLGSKLPKTPKWKFSLSPEYVMTLPNEAALRFGVDYTHTASIFNDSINTSLLRRPDTDIVNASVTYISPDSSYEVVAGGTNITDDRFLTTGNEDTADGIFYGTYNAPAEWYLKLRFKLKAPKSPEPLTPAPPPPVTPVAPPPTAAPEIARQFQVFFDFDKSAITEAASRVIQAAADAVKSGHIVHITVTGHTDTVGSAAYNQALSVRRADAVKAGLVADGVADGSIATIGVGKTGLLVPTADGVREPQNRRAVIELQ